MSALPPKADIANYFNALADDIASASADTITEAPVTVGRCARFFSSSQGVAAGWVRPRAYPSYPGTPCGEIAIAIWNHCGSHPPKNFSKFLGC
jgi:hypothetical protein